MSFSALFFNRDWERERVIENKGEEFRRKKNMEIQSGGEKMRNASAQQGAASKVKMSDSEHEHRKQNIWVSSYDNSSLEIMCN